MTKLHRVDVHGHSVRGKAHDKNHNHFAIATLNKSMRLHQTNLSIDDDSRVHGDNRGHVFLVADGLSSGPTPARASRTAIDSVVQYFLNEMPWSHLAHGSPKEVTLALEDALRHCQAELHRVAGVRREGMGTTLTLAFVFWPDLYVVHVGNNRCYLHRNGNLRQLTTDHTLAQVRREIDGTVTARSQNRLWNVVGGDEFAVQPEVQHLLLEPGDVLALLTDGVLRESAHEDIGTILDADVPAERTCERLVGKTGLDDRTAVVVRFLPHEQRHVVAAVETPPASDVAHVPVPEPRRGRAVRGGGDPKDPKRQPEPTPPSPPPSPERRPTPESPKPIQLPGKEPEIEQPDPPPQPGRPNPSARLDAMRVAATGVESSGRYAVVKRSREIF